MSTFVHDYSKSPPKKRRLQMHKHISKENRNPPAEAEPALELELHMKQLQKQFQAEMRMQKEHLEKVEEKCDKILERAPDPVPNPNPPASELEKLRKELKMERKKRKDLEKNFMECVDKFLAALVEISTKVEVLEEGRTEESEKRKQSTVKKIIPAQPVNQIEKKISEKKDDIIFKKDWKPNFQKVPEKAIPNAIQHGKKDNLKTEALVHDILHMKAPTAGRYLPFMCQCGLEFGSEDDLSRHTGKGAKKEEKPMMEMKSSSSDLQPSNDITTFETTFQPTSSSSYHRGPPSKIGNLINSTMESRPPMSNNKQHGLAKEKKIGEKKSRLYCKCGRVYSSKDALSRHISSGRRRFKCNLCSITYVDLPRLRVHMRRKHNIVDHWKGKVFCSQCDKMCESMQELVDHRFDFHRLPSN